MKNLLQLLLSKVSALSTHNKPAPVNIPIPAFTETPFPTNMQLHPTSADCCAIVSSDVAEFWFPVPNKKEWEWSTSGPNNISTRYSWTVEFGNIKESMERMNGIFVYCGYKQAFSQTGSFEDMLKTCMGGIGSPSQRTSDLTPLVSYLNNGILIQITNSGWIKTLMDEKPELINFGIAQITKITPSQTVPSSKEAYAVITPNKAQFWFPLADKTEWTWNSPFFYHPMMVWQEHNWTVHFGADDNLIVAILPHNKNKSIQTGSFEDALKACDETYLLITETDQSISLTASYRNGGLLLETSDAEALKLLNEHALEPMFFDTLENFGVTPIYK